MYRPPAPTPLSSLSGGNQQKVLLGRWVNAAPRVLLLNDPMRGVDPNSKTDLLDVLTDLVAEGLTIVLLSTASKNSSRYAVGSRCFEIRH